MATEDLQVWLTDIPLEVPSTPVPVGNQGGTIRIPIHSGKGMPRSSVARGPKTIYNVDLNVKMVTAVIEHKAKKAVMRAARSALASAIQRAPVRHIFKGGRRPTNPRFYTLQEAKLMLPSFLRTEPRSPAAMAEGAASRRRSAGRPSADTMTRAEALAYLQTVKTHTSRNRAQNWQRTGQRSHRAPDVPAPREVSETASGVFHLTDQYFERNLTTRARYDLNHPLRYGNSRFAVAYPRGLTPTLGARSRGSTQDESLAAAKDAAMGYPVHVGTLGGSLRRSIVIQDSASTRGPKISIVAGGDDAPYARFVEFGTRHAAAQPFLRPALKHVEPIFKQLVMAEFPGSR